MGGPLDSKDWLAATIEARLDGHDPAAVRGRLPRELRDADPEGPDLEARARMLVTRSLRHRLLDRQAQGRRDLRGHGRRPHRHGPRPGRAARGPLRPRRPPRRARRHPGRGDRGHRRRPQGRSPEGRRRLSRRGAAHAGQGRAAPPPRALPSRGPRERSPALRRHRRHPAPSAGAARARLLHGIGSSSPTTPSPTWSRPATRSSCSSRRMAGLATADPLAPRPHRRVVSRQVERIGLDRERVQAARAAASAPREPGGDRRRHPSPAAPLPRRATHPRLPGNARRVHAARGIPGAVRQRSRDPGRPAGRHAGRRRRLPCRSPGLVPGLRPPGGGRRRSCSRTSGTSSESGWWTRSPRW